jgi:hypothetical protein
VLGRPPFHDTALTTCGDLSYVGGNWTRDIAFAGTSIPLTVRAWGLGVWVGWGVWLEPLSLLELHGGAGDDLAAACGPAPEPSPAPDPSPPIPTPPTRARRATSRRHA